MRGDRLRCESRATPTRDAAVWPLLRTDPVFSIDQYHFQEPEPVPQSDCSPDAMRPELAQALVCAVLFLPEQCPPSVPGSEMLRGQG